VTRQVGLYGCLPPKNAPAIKASAVLKGIVPEHPPAADYLRAMNGGWAMLGNGPDPENVHFQVPKAGCGDCVSVMLANCRRLVTATLTGTEAYPGLAECIQFYKTQNKDFPNQDGGMDIQTALEECVNNGYADGTKMVAFAKVDHMNPDECKAAIAATGFLLVGIDVEDVNEQQFADEHPWGFHATAQDLGGHGVLVGGYSIGHFGSIGSQGALGGDEKMVTWAEESSFTDLFWQRRVNQAWLAIWPEHRGNKEFEDGVDWAELEQQVVAITGHAIASQ
jgi:hypothetical protein